jgi:hypothetical protein
MQRTNCSCLVKRFTHSKIALARSFHNKEFNCPQTRVDLEGWVIKFKLSNNVKVIIALILGMVIRAGAFWYLSSTDRGAELRSAGKQVESATKPARDAVRQNLSTLDLNPQEIREELARTGQIVRRKTREAGQAISDAASDTRITATIKGKLVADRDLSALSVSVSTTGGVVTLSGAVSSAEQVGRVMNLALETEGVREVISTLQLKAPAGKK